MNKGDRVTISDVARGMLALEQELSELHQEQLDLCAQQKAVLVKIDVCRASMKKLAAAAQNIAK